MLAISFKTEYIADAALVLVFMIWAIIDGRKGFINCFFSFISAIVCTVAVLFLSGPLLRTTGGLFGAEEWMQEGIGGWLSGTKPFNIDVSLEGWRAQLDALSLPQFLKDAALTEIENTTGGIPAGTMLGEYLGGTIGSLLATILCAILVLIAAKLVMGLFKGMLNGVADSCFLISKLNVLGGVMAGFFKAFAVTCILLAVLSLIPNEGLSNFFNNTMLLKGLYNDNPLIKFFAWLKA